MIPAVVSVYDRSGRRWDDYPVCDRSRALMIASDLRARGLHAFVQKALIVAQGPFSDLASRTVYGPGTTLEAAHEPLRFLPL